MNKLYNIDNMEFMQDKLDNFYDLAVVDPPYGIHDKISDIKRKSSQKNKKKFADMYDKKQWDKKRADKKYFDELFRISKHIIICGGNYFTDFIPPSRGWILWDKMGEGLTCVNDELIYTNFDLAIKTFSRCHGLDKGFMNKEGANIHPTQKPVALYKWLLTNYAKPGFKLLDTHSGSGSFRIAAYDMGFDLDSCELDADYCRDNEARYQQHIQQNELFSKEAIQENIYSQKELI